MDMARSGMARSSIMRCHGLPTYFLPISLWPLASRPAIGSCIRQRLLLFPLIPSSFSSCSQNLSKTSLQPDYEEFYRYTSGRWLWDEDDQLRQRYKRFNVPEIKNIAARSIGAQTCNSMTKFAEGGFNKVFRLVMNDGSVVIARIPDQRARPPFRTIASEVATMDFVRIISLSLGLES